VTVRAGLATWFEVARAMTCAVPFATAVTTPDEETAAIEVASLDQLNVAPEMGLPPESNAIATRDTVSPRLASDALDAPPDVANETLTTTWATATRTDPLTPFAVALMVAFPLPSDVTKPAVETLATDGALLDQVNVTLEVTSPCGLVAVAESCTVSFSFDNDVELAALTVTVSTYTAAESTVISPPGADETVPTVAIAAAVEPSGAVDDTVARPSVPMVATDGSLVVQTGAGAPATG
jgi:hypothetical protein